jgi:hypothetical protein
MRIEIRNADRVIAELKELMIQYPEIARDETRATLTLIAARMESEVMQRTPAGVGGAAGLRGSIFGEVRGSAKKMQGIWGTPVKYGEVIEYGRKPGKFPPVLPIEKWVQRILGIPNTAAEGSRLRQSYVVAAAIARAIFRRGYSPNGNVGPRGARMFEKAWDESEDWVANLIERLPQQIVNRAGGQ